MEVKLLPKMYLAKKLEITFFGFKQEEIWHSSVKSDRFKTASATSVQIAYV